MRVPEAIVEILKREGVEFIIGYPVNPVLEAAAQADIRPIIVRQERTGIHMADAFSRLNSGRKIGVFAMQSGPGTENAFGAVAQAYSESVPIIVIPGGYARHLTNIFPNFNAFVNYRNVTKWCEQVTVAGAVVEAMRRAFTQVRNGRPGPALIEIPGDVFREEIAEPLDYTPTYSVRSAPDPRDVDRAAEALLAAERPVIYAGQGVHYARAWDELRGLAELLEAPVTTSLEGKSAFPENHPLALGSGGRSLPGPVHQHMQDADLIFGVGCSFSRTGFGIQMPAGKTYVHATVDPIDLNKDVPAKHALIGDAALTLQSLTEAVHERINGRPRDRREAVVAQIRTQRAAWMQRWLPRLTATETPLSPYRVIWDLLHTVDVATTINTHDAGSPRDQL
ncbi:MAG: thiamine pyrophosphate-binding protein [Dehalococcoidia bacterium]